MLWVREPLGEICRKGRGRIQTGPFGSQLHGSDYSTDGTPVVMPADIADGKVAITRIARVAENHVERLKRHKLAKGDIVYGRRGDIGRQALVRDENVGWLCGTGCLKITLGNGPLSYEFLHRYLSTKAVVSWIEGQAVGATMPNLNTGILERVPVFYPEDRATQKKIAATLTAYDDLIENNQRRIALLEKMAEEIYREWFVRMRFPCHENAKFSKGLPADWDTKRVKEIVVRKGFGRIYREDELSDDGEVIVIDQSRADCLGYYDGEPQHMASPDSPIILFGDHSCKMVLMTKPFSLAENVIPFMPKPKVSPYFLFHLVKDLARTTEYKRHWTDLTNREVLVPKESLQVEFENVVKHNHEQIEVLQQAILKAEKVRNMLLPRLISGKLSVEKLDIQFPPGMEEFAHEH
ncbi:type I restriction enzyme S subunit [Methylobacter tundripaludum]|uniref:Type I restriction enzyme S subunit n=1 Tax=Methylobacter tundripaludum TaxID=173365 RepID=A0A2S6GSJ2_9GAMM|nr:restriction endonuclease subunit S [Methylobacter tundripaludum]PPK68180.1 type I restriction enzyme S subunit [Methylobacter tundripaludum]